MFFVRSSEIFPQLEMALSQLDNNTFIHSLTAHSLSHPRFCRLRVELNQNSNHKEAFHFSN